MAPMQLHSELNEWHTRHEVFREMNAIVALSLPIQARLTRQEWAAQGVARHNKGIGRYLEELLMLSWLFDVILCVTLARASDFVRLDLIQTLSS